jgi:hypothetical protein
MCSWRQISFVSSEAVLLLTTKRGAGKYEYEYEYEYTGFVEQRKNECNGCGPTFDVSLSSIDIRSELFILSSSPRNKNFFLLRRIDTYVTQAPLKRQP